MRGDNDTVEVLTQRVNNIEVHRFPDHNEEDRKLNGDGMVTSLRHETHMTCKSTDILADNTYQATHPWCGGVRENVMDIHTDTRGPNSHSRYQDDRSPESVFDRHKIDFVFDRQKLVMIKLTTRNIIMDDSKATIYK